MQRPFAHLAGLGVYLPSQVVTNQDFATRLETSDQWIVERTGIRERRYASPAETVSVMARGASEAALQRAAQGHVVPDAFTHGSSEQRVRWLRIGMESGDPNACDTFNTPNL